MKKDDWSQAVTATENQLGELNYKLSIYQALQDGKEIEFTPINNIGGPWYALPSTAGNLMFSGYRYRIKETRYWDCIDDVPLNCWIRAKDVAARRFVTAVNESGIFVQMGMPDRGSSLFKWSEIAHDIFDYSIDGVKWSPLIKVQR